MRVVPTLLAGLLALAVLPGMSSTAQAGTWRDGIAGTDATAVQYTLVNDRYDRHRGYHGWYGHRDRYWDGWRFYDHRYYPRYYSNRYYYRPAPRMYYYKPVPRSYYVVPPPVYYYYGPPAYYYGGSGFNLGFNLDFD